MRRDYEKLFTNLDPKEPSAGLFDRIILAIKREQELSQGKRLLFGFLFLLLVSLVTTPFSGALLINQIKNSGISYFISTAISDLGAFSMFWEDFGLAVLESLPIGGLIAFFLSIAVSVFTFRLFLYRKKLLFGYLRQSFS